MNIEDNEEKIESILDRETLREEIRNVLNKLSYMEREVIIMRYGIGGGYTYTSEEIAKKFNLSLEGVRQIESKAIEKLQHLIGSKELEEFLDNIKNFKEIVVSCPNCRQKAKIPEGASLITCHHCKAAFDYPTFKLESQPSKTQINLFEGKETKAMSTPKESPQEKQSSTDIKQPSMGEEREKTVRLFDFFAKVLSIDLPVIRNILEHKEQLWWLNDVPVGPSCQLRKVNSDEASKETSEEEWWLRVKKTEIKEAPSLPEELEGWVELDFHNPSKLPQIIPSRTREVPIDNSLSKDSLFKNPDKSALEKFEDDPERPNLLSNYIVDQWEPWSKKYMPYFRANQFYSELYSLYQRLQIDGERIEFLFGHALLTWKHKQGDTINHPLFITPLEIHFDPNSRTISILPSASLPTVPEFDCLRDLEYDNMAKIVELIDKLAKEPPDVWDNNEMHGWAQTITGLISPEGVNKYEDATCSNPPIVKQPAIWNASVFFVRPRARSFWVRDAEQVRDAIKNNSPISWLISSLAGNSDDKQVTNIDNENITTENIPEGELLLPLKYNDEQKEIAQRLRNHNGVLVQGPPGTGKSHTIANIICSLLAQGKRILVTAQTERALRVLREKIPKEIRSLCVSQLGSDRASRDETEAAVKAIIGAVQSSSREIQLHIDEIRQKLKSNRENQATIRNAIRQRVEINFETLSLGPEKIDAVKAAKEVSTNEKEHGWLPDKLSPSDDPPLTNEELEALCQLLSQIEPGDRQSLSKKLPRLEDLPHPDKFKEVISRLQDVSSSLKQFDKTSNVFVGKLKNASSDFVEETNRLTKEAISKLHNIKQPWQREILSHLSAQGNQRALWHEFVSKAQAILDMTWPHFKKILHHEINCMPTDSHIDYELGISQLKARKLKRPFFGWSKEAIAVLQSCKVDGKQLETPEQLEALEADFNYKKNIYDFKKLWSRYQPLVEAPALEDNISLPLQDYEEKLNRVKEVLDWEEKFGLILASELETLGFQRQKAYQVEFLQEFLCALEYKHLVNEQASANRIFKEWINNLPKETDAIDIHPLWKHITYALYQKDYASYQEAYNEVARLNQLKPKHVKLETLLKRLRNIAPLWASQLEAKTEKNGNLTPPKDWQMAWRWSRLNRWLEDLHNRGDIDSLQKELERGKDKERDLVVELVTNLTWQRQIEQVSDEQEKALNAWSLAMKKGGQFTGKHAQHYLATARRAMQKAREAVPVWIMPLHRVVQSFSPPRPDMFDVVIVDEASQCDLRAFPILYRAKKVLIIGDPEQISPEGLFINKEKVFQLIKLLLKDIPFPERFAVENSLYDNAEFILRKKNRIFLKEHFRSVPEIIEFSNHHIYVNDRIEPLRIPNPGESLPPKACNPVPVQNGYKNENNDVNEPEAETLVNKLVECCKDPKYQNKTMGVISLLGEQQAKYIDKLLRNSLDFGEIERRKIICGDAYSFQGDERDVMFLSLVVANNATFRALTTRTDKQRFNVAATRARDQVFLFHSVDLNDIGNKDCMRYKLLDWYCNQRKAQIEAGKEVLKRKKESDFEEDVGVMIIDRGYKVIPQYQVLSGKRIDLVIQGKESRLAVECDGDKHHDMKNWENDQRREEQLRRAGWIFWRVMASAFYRNPEKALASLWEKLAELKIEPYS